MLLKRIRSLLFPLLLLVIGLYLGPLKIYGPHFSKIPGDLGDARFNNYILEHDYLYFTGNVTNYWDAPFMYPFKNVIAYSDNLLGTAPLYAFFRLIGNDRETAFQCWLLLLFILNYACCYWALNNWSKNNILSSTGAYIFAFSILLVGNIYNVQTFPRFVVPLVFYWSWKYFNQKEIKYFMYVALGIVFQFYCGIYLGFLLLYALFFFFLSYLVVYKDFSIVKEFKKARTLCYHVFILIGAGIVFYPLIHPYLAISKTVFLPSFQDILPTVPTLRSYFFTSKAPVCWQILSEHGKVLESWWCHFLFIGALPWLAIILIPVIFFRKKTAPVTKRFIAFLSISLFGCFIFCLNLNGFSLYEYIYAIPGFSSMRSMNRIINTEIMLFILVFVFVFNELSNHHVMVKRFILCLPLLVILENTIDITEIMRYDKRESQQQVELVKQKIQMQYDKKGKAIAYMPENVNDLNMVHLHLDVMLAAQELSVPCVNAYSGRNPGEFNGFSKEVSEASLLYWCKFNQISPESIQQIRP